MQNRGALWVFTILLALACLWQLSFSFFTSGVERKATEVAVFQMDSALAVPGNEGLDADSLKLEFENKYLRDNSEEQIYPVFGYTYRECKEKEINLGLDLKGGMAVTLEVSIPELVVNLSENSQDETFRSAISNARDRMTSSDEDFISLFRQEWDKLDPNAKMAAVFHSADKKEMFPREADNDGIVEALRREARAAINNTEKILRTRIDKFGVAQPSIQKQQFSGRIQIELPGVKDKERVRKVLQSTANLEFWETYDNADVYPLLESANQRLRALASPKDTSASILEEDLAEDILTDTTIVAQETDSLVQDSVAAEDEVLGSLEDEDPLAADDTLAQADFAKENPLFAKLTPSVFAGQGGGYRLSQGPAVGNARVSDTASVSRTLRQAGVRDIFPKDLKFLWGAKPIEGTDVMTLYAMKVPRGGKPKLDGSAITDAAQDFDMKGDVEVRMQMDSEGAQTWKVMTGDNVGRSIAIVLDQLVYSAPTVISEIGGGRSSISMGTGKIDEQIQEAEDLANILKAGALPAPARIIDETVVGPSLGKDNVNQGVTSFAVALLMVMAYMVLYYAGAGWVAVVALLVNLFVLVGSLASLQASLTLPGIAGIVLTMGMAVDANVLIDERVREELRAGRMIKSAVDLGYKGALSAIIDSNVTTFVTAVILYVFGTGPIRGFATTLGLGILTSLFTAIFLSRMIITHRLEKGKTLSFWNKWSKNILVNANYDWMSKRKIFYAISAVLIGIGVASMVTRGFNLGVDFSGGRTYVVKFQEEVKVDAVKGALEPMFLSEGRQYTTAVKTYGSARQ
ncbi:MAG: protein translocase subunit SecD, partial [Flavobacteriales bacterium]|nr:protein translocase subunit SecD [Flavobacteriales bacterium]